MDKLHYKRERDAGTSTLAYFLSKDTIDLFNILIKPLVFLSMYYSFSNPRSTFLENYIIVLCLMYCVTGIGYVFAIALQPAQAQLVANSHIFLLSHLVFLSWADNSVFIHSGACFFPLFLLSLRIKIKVTELEGSYVITAIRRGL